MNDVHRTVGYHGEHIDGTVDKHTTLKFQCPSGVKIPDSRPVHRVIVNLFASLLICSGNGPQSTIKNHRRQANRKHAKTTVRRKDRAYLRNTRRYVSQQKPTEFFSWTKRCTYPRHVLPLPLLYCETDYPFEVKSCPLRQR